MLYSLLFSDPFFVSAVSAGLEGDDGDAKDRIKEAVGTGPDAAFRLAASENATGAAIGLCWANSPPLRKPWMNTLYWSAVGPKFQIWSAGCNAN